MPKKKEKEYILRRNIKQITLKFFSKCTVLMTTSNFLVENAGSSRYSWDTKS
jgi:hypothetical protein